MFSPLTPENIEVILPHLIQAIGQPPSCVIMDRAGANLGTYLKGWADKMKLPVELEKLSPFVNDLEASLVGHLRAVEKADAVIAFWKNDNTLVAQAVRSACSRKGTPLIVFYAW